MGAKKRRMSTGKSMERLQRRHLKTPTKRRRGANKNRTAKKRKDTKSMAIKNTRVRREVIRVANTSTFISITITRHTVKEVKEVRARKSDSYHTMGLLLRRHI